MDKLKQLLHEYEGKKGKKRQQNMTQNEQYYGKTETIYDTKIRGNLCENDSKTWEKNELLILLTNWKKLRHENCVKPKNKRQQNKTERKSNSRENWINSPQEN